MRLVVLASLTALVVLPGTAQPIVEGSAQRVVICLSGRYWDADIACARYVAARMFAGIGITTEWHWGERSCRDETRRHFVIALEYDAPAEELPNALALAQPYEGVHVQVFYTRLRGSVDTFDVPYLLAHVLVHELTHMMQVTGHHSSSGVMKARWSPSDHRAMRSGSLGFTPEDVQLIREGLNAWASQREAVWAHKTGHTAR
jgi:hypothetical protein